MVKLANKYSCLLYVSLERQQLLLVLVEELETNEGLVANTENKRRIFGDIYFALDAYKAVHGNLLVPYKFVIPEGDVRFPVETWGMKLGFNVNNIRHRGDYSEHRVKLGFERVWGGGLYVVFGV